MKGPLKKAQNHLRDARDTLLSYEDRLMELENTGNAQDQVDLAILKIRQALDHVDRAYAELPKTPRGVSPFDDLWKLKQL